jgi:hypothetical protein
MSADFSRASGKALNFIVATFLIACALGVSAGVAQQSDYDAPPADTLYPLPEIKGAVPWELLLNVELVFEGIDLVPDYSEDVRALDGETVKMVGFLLPLDSTGTHLLLSMISPNCPYCLPGGPEMFVELIANDKIEWTDDAAVVSGRFELLEDSLSGYFYRMTDVVRIEDPPSF